MEVTRGSVWLAGYNVSTQTNLARAHLGLCPQHNVLFSELTVREHLEFFARLKGFSGKDLDEEIDNLIDRLEMQEKVSFFTRCSLPEVLSVDALVTLLYGTDI